jgi:hypothetical protein
MSRLPPEGLLLISLGGLWLYLWRGPWRRWGVVAIAAGFASMMLTKPPDILIADGGRFVAARAPDGHYFVSADKGEKIVRSFFASETGEALAAWPASGSGTESGLDCAGELCVYTARGRRVAIATGDAALPIKCGGLDAIISQVPAGFRCRSMMPVIDRIDSWRRGSVALWLDRDGVTVESANESRGDRLWVPHPTSGAPACLGRWPGQKLTSRPIAGLLELLLWSLRRQYEISGAANHRPLACRRWIRCGTGGYRVIGEGNELNCTLAQRQFVRDSLVSFSQR